MKDQNWRLLAACRNGVDPDIFAADRPGATETVQAQTFCAICPVQPECLQLGIDSGAWGIYGGEFLRAGHIIPTPGPRMCSNGCGRLAAPAGDGVGITHPCCGATCRHQQIVGTAAGYRFHRRRAEPVCDPCAQAYYAGMAERQRKWRERESRRAQVSA